jgi:ornithine cyclodeaminase/alanine dehydrogenase-like protein (mu-crystallin family)
MGYFQGCPEVYAELGELVTGKKKGRETSTERTFAVNLGVALEDMAVATMIFDRAVQKKIGTWLPL